MDSRFGFYIEKYTNLNLKNLLFYMTLKDNNTLNLTKAGEIIIYF